MLYYVKYTTKDENDNDVERYSTYNVSEDAFNKIKARNPNLIEITKDEYLAFFSSVPQEIQDRLEAHS